MACTNPALNPVYRGDSKSWTMTITDVNDDPVNITGDTITLTVKENKNDVAALISTEITSFTDAVNGLVTITIDPDESYVLPANSSVYVGVTWFDGDNVVTLMDTTMQVKEPVLTPTAP